MDVVESNTGMLVKPNYSFESCPRDVDILLVPGGNSSGLIADSRIREFVSALAASDSLELLLSVCTGALLLGDLRLLDGLKCTTHWQFLDKLKEIAPEAEVVGDSVRYVDSGRVITSAGVSAGIDMSLHVVERLLGKDVAQETAKQMEYMTGDRKL